MTLIFILSFWWSEISIFILDINECADKNGDCEQQCINEEGGYHCACDDGFVLNDDLHTCKPEDVQVINILILSLF